MVVKNWFNMKRPKSPSLRFYPAEGPIIDVPPTRAPAVGTVVSGSDIQHPLPHEVLNRTTEETVTTTTTTRTRKFAPPPPPVVRKKRKRKRPISPSLVIFRPWLPDPPTEGRVFQNDIGGLLVSCGYGNCTRKREPSHFIPRKNPRDRNEYVDAIAALAVAIEAKDDEAYAKARDAIGRLARKTCDHCMASAKKAAENPDRKDAKCAAEWERMKREVFCPCARCGTNRCPTANHKPDFAKNARAYNKCVKEEGVEVAEGKYPKDERKLEDLSKYRLWAKTSMGGVEGMRREAAKCEPLCGMCHALDPSSNSSNERRADPAKVKREGKTQERFTSAVFHARYSMEKRDFVNAIKRKIGGCERGADCPCDGPSHGVCKAGFEQCYDIDHIVPGIKKCGISKLMNEHRCPATVKPLILAELGLPPDWDVDKDPIPPVAERRCRLLCHNCHMLRKQWDTPPGAAGPSGA